MASSEEQEATVGKSIPFKNDATQNVLTFPLGQEPASTEVKNNNFSSIEIEVVLLANLLNDNMSFEEVSDFLLPEHFAYGEHGKIYETISVLISGGRVADPISLVDLFEKDENLKEQGGKDYLARLANSVISVGNTKQYGQFVYDAHLKRQLMHLGHEIVHDAGQSFFDLNGRQQIEKIEQRLYSLATLGQIDRKLLKLEDNDLVEKLQRARTDGIANLGILTGYKNLDELLGGFQKGDLVIIAARPSMGKTAFAVNVAYNVAKHFIDDKRHGAKVLFFSLEMSVEQLVTRVYAQSATLSSDAIRKGTITHRDFERVKDVDKEIKSHKIPLYIDDTPCLSLAALRSRAMKQKRVENIGLIVIDYLQMIRIDGKSGNRVQEVSEITRQLKALGHDLDIPVVALSQLSRNVEQREDKKPLLSDLRESGSIEQDADVVMFLYREAYYLKRSEPSPHTIEHQEWEQKMEQYRYESEINVAKHRNGAIGNVRIRFDEMSTKFSNW